ncbi:Superkiller protein 3 [Spiromyces aspiralis]|uniref:Superkiller protein 3 n=1 Tax=Spiromyces aspiralis TaxID=68401 RepID=A0ACC1HKT1_9FUNG|nr:Superkiller protein 3 [Spiromyces aspiralis]
MSSNLVKKLLKSAKTSIGERDYEKAYEDARRALEFEADSYNGNVLLGVAAQNLKKWDESEQAYLKAIEINDDNMLAHQGLNMLYKKWKGEGCPEHLRTIECIEAKYREKGEIRKCWEAVQELIECHTKRDRADDLIRVWSSLAPGGKRHYLYESSETLKGLPPVIEVLEKEIELEEHRIKRTIEREVKAKKSWLNAGPISAIKAAVKQSVWSSTRVVAALRDLLWLIGPADPKYVLYVDKYIWAAEKQLTYTPQHSNELRDQMLDAAREAVARQDDLEVAYRIMIEVGDYNDKDSGYWQLLRTYAERYRDGWLWGACMVHLGIEDDASPKDLYAKYNSRLHGEVSSPFCQVGLVRLLTRAGLYGQIVKGVAAKALHTLVSFEKSHRVMLARSRELVELDLADAYVRTSGSGERERANAMRLYKKYFDPSKPNMRVATAIGALLVEDAKFEEAKDVLELVIGDSGQQREDELSTAEPGVEETSVVGLLGYIEYKLGNYSRAKELLHKALAADPANAENHCHLGEVYWQIGGALRTDKQYAFKEWITAAQLDNDYADAFTSLGKWYLSVANDLVRAKKCLTKSFQLRPGHEETAKMLYDICINESDGEDAAEVILAKINEMNPRNEWAWRKLGFLHSNQGRYDEAVREFQNALKASQQDAMVWEGLADAYLQTGRLVAALGAGQKALALAPDSVSVHVLIASVYETQRDFAQAIPYLEKAKELLVARAGADAGRMEEVVPLLVQEMECGLSHAYHLYREGYYGQVVENCNVVLCKALETLQEHVARGNLVVVWKLVYDSCMLLITKLRNSWTVKPTLQLVNVVDELLQIERATVGCVEIPRWLKDELKRSSVFMSSNSGPASGIDQSKRYISELCNVATGAALCCIAKAGSVNVASSGWHDLAMTYLVRYNLEHPFELQLRATRAAPWLQSGESEDPRLVSGLRCVNVALRLDPINAKSFNLLTVLAMRAGRYKLAQHAGIQASRLDKQSPVPWTNLGFLYFLAEDKGLANKAFSRAQTLDPEYVPSWLGQAMLAERLGDSEALSLYQHCVELCGASLLEANYGFALECWRRRTRGAMTARAVFAMRKYLEQFGNDAAANHLLGLLLEANGEHSLASRAFEDALEAFGSTGEVEKRYTVLYHLTRCYCASGHIDDALRIYTVIDELLTGFAPPRQQQQLYVTLCRGLAYYFANELEASLLEFEKSLNITNSGHELERRGDVAVLLAQVLWTLGTDEHRAMARQQLLQAMDGNNLQYIPGLCMLFAIGLIQGDSELLAAVSSEIAKLPTDKRASSEIIQLDMLYTLLYQGPMAARRVLTQAIHNRQADATLWIQLATLQLTHCSAGGNQEARLAASAAQSAVSLITNTLRGDSADLIGLQSPPYLSVFQEAGPSSLAAQAYLASAYSECSAGTTGVKQAKRMAQKAVHLEPWNAQAWHALSVTGLADHIRAGNGTPEELDVVDSLLEYWQVRRESQDRITTTLADTRFDQIQRLWSNLFLSFTSLCRAACSDGGHEKTEGREKCLHRSLELVESVKSQLPDLPSNDLPIDHLAVECLVQYSRVLALSSSPATSSSQGVILHLQDALKIPQPPLILYSQLSSAILQSGDAEGAEAVLRSALEFGGSSLTRASRVYLTSHLVSLYIKCGRLEEALESTKTGLEASPDHPTLVGLKALCLIAMGRGGAARKVVEKLREKDRGAEQGKVEEEAEAAWIRLVVKQLESLNI